MVLAIDLGTSSVRSALLDAAAEIVRAQWRVDGIGSLIPSVTPPSSMPGRCFVQLNTAFAGRALA